MLGAGCSPTLSGKPCTPQSRLAPWGICSRSHRRAVSPQEAPARVPARRPGTLRVPGGGARAQRQRRHACAHARRRVGPPSPPREDRLVLPAKSGSGSQEAPSGGVHGGDGSEAGGKPERLHPLCRSRGVEAVRGRVGPGAVFPGLLEKGLRADGVGAAGCGGRAA